MTYRTVRPWPPLEDFLGWPLAVRIKFVRETLASPREGSRKEHMTHDDFAAAVGAANRQRAIAWEKGERPRDYAEKIAALTPYPPSAVGADDEAELLRETYGVRLTTIEAWVVARTEERLLDAVELLSGRVESLEQRVAQLEPREKRG